MPSTAQETAQNDQVSASQAQFGQNQSSVRFLSQLISAGGVLPSVPAETARNTEALGSLLTQLGQQKNPIVACPAIQKLVSAQASSGQPNTPSFSGLNCSNKDAQSASINSVCSPKFNDSVPVPIESAFLSVRGKINLCPKSPLEELQSRLLQCKTSFLSPRTELGQFSILQRPSSCH